MSLPTPCVCVCVCVCTWLERTLSAKGSFQYGTNDMDLCSASRSVEYTDLITGDSDVTDLHTHTHTHREGSAKCV